MAFLEAETDRSRTPSAPAPRMVEDLSQICGRGARICGVLYSDQAELCSFCGVPVRSCRTVPESIIARRERQRTSAASVEGLSSTLQLHFRAPGPPLGQVERMRKILPTAAAFRFHDAWPEIEAAPCGKVPDCPLPNALCCGTVLRRSCADLRHRVWALEFPFVGCSAVVRIPGQNMVL